MTGAGILRDNLPRRNAGYTLSVPHFGQDHILYSLEGQRATSTGGVIVTCTTGTGRCLQGRPTAPRLERVRSGSLSFFGFFRFLILTS
jgi:hypothetical protein